MKTRPQRTIKRPVSYSGIGIHTGKEVSLSFYPAPSNTGILFQRTDLPDQPTIPALIDQVRDTERSTTIGTEFFYVKTVEHVLAALSACQIDNVYIKLSDEEPPIADGSSLPFIDLIEKAEIVDLEEQKDILVLQRPVYFSRGQSHLIALPSEKFQISYTLHYPNTPLIKSQYLSLEITQENFKEKIASCRTFALFEEINYLIEHGLIRGGSLENAVVIKDDVVLSKEGLRFPDEMVRHKILDLIGDLSLIGSPFSAHVIAICSGHSSNVAFGKELMKQFS